MNLQPTLTSPHLPAAAWRRILIQASEHCPGCLILMPPRFQALKELSSRAAPHPTSSAFTSPLFLPLAVWGPYCNSGDLLAPSWLPVLLPMPFASAFSSAVSFGSACSSLLPFILAAVDRGPCLFLGFVLIHHSIGGCFFCFVPTLKTCPLVPSRIGTLAHSVLSRLFASGHWLQDLSRMSPAADVDDLGLIPMPSPNGLHLLLSKRWEVLSPSEVFVGAHGGLPGRWEK